VPESAATATLLHVPAVQFMHASEFCARGVREYLPTPQSLQSEAAPALSIVWNLPCAQAKQFAEVLLPVVGEYLPLPQFWHVLSDI